MKRLDFIASLTKGSNKILDIGCDHGLLIYYALTKYDVSYAIAADINSSPLNNAFTNLSKYNLSNRVEFFLSDGFKNINSDFDTVVIAGMGGRLINDILINGINKLSGKKIIVEANNQSNIIREFAMNNGFKIIDEYSLIDNDKYYEIIIMIEGQANYTELEIKFGPFLLKKREESFINFYKNQYNNLNNALLNTTNENKIIEINDKIKLLKLVINNEY